MDIKLKYLDEENGRRREIAQYYCDNIKNPKIILPVLHHPSSIIHHLSHIWHLFVIRTPERDSLQKYLATSGIETIIHYPVPPHKQQAYNEWNSISLPITEKIHSELLSMPMGSHLSNEDLGIIVEKINAYA